MAETFSVAGEPRDEPGSRFDVAERAKPLARLRRSRDVERVLTEGRRWQDSLLVVRTLKVADDEPIRLAVVVPAKCGPAVARNRIKRWVRESVRQFLRQVPPAESWWLAVVARPAVGATAHHRIRGSLGALLTRAGVVPQTARPG